MVVVYFKQQM